MIRLKISRLSTPRYATATGWQDKVGVQTLLPIQDIIVSGLRNLVAGVDYF
jgi:hypothetical protein